MRTSPLRHTLAVLRTTIGLGQKEMAELVGRSTRTIQAVELGQLPLSEELATEIFRQTGVGLKWLTANDTSAPIVDSFNQRYDKEYFEMVRADRIDKKFSEGAAATAMVVLHEVIKDFAAVYISAVSLGPGKMGALHYRTYDFLDKLKKDFGHKPLPAGNAPRSDCPPGVMEEWLKEDAKKAIEAMWGAIELELTKHEKAKNHSGAARKK